MNHSPIELTRVHGQNYYFHWADNFVNFCKNSYTHNWVKI